MRFRASFAAIACVAALASAPLVVRGDEPTAEDKRAAAHAFDGGEKAFAAGDYLRAAELFEEANKRAPHFANVWNAARAYHKLGELARAATLYGRYLRIAPADAPDRDGATAALRELAPKLGRLDVYAPAAKDVKVDGKPVEDPAVYLPPGLHILTATLSGKEVSRAVSVEAGASTSTALDNPTAPEPSAAPSASAPPPKPPPAVSAAPPIATPPSRGWSPAVVLVGGSLTAIALGFMIASGVDTDSSRSAYDQLPDAQKAQAKQDGLSKQLRTNVLVGVSAGLGALTGVAAIWLVDWHRKDNGAKIGVAPDGIRVVGSF